ncbi:Uncharacterized protein FWK35_00003471 [Aphis craccivora]|uniref:Uncharacterized protein n=1 Tax=Aphis craccivora TaxID=307492 RepID=A0A6G0ZQN9_APHCR|nr:Uncharacterized protein FWK35_00003471 [Aphis craccivora]
MTPNVPDTLSSKPEIANRRLSRDYQVDAIKTFDRKEGRLRSHTPQAFVKKSVGVIEDKKRDKFFGDNEGSIVDRYEGAFGNYDRRRKRVIRK